MTDYNKGRAYPGASYRRFAEAHLQTAGFADAGSIVENLYLDCLPTEDEYNREVAHFAASYREAMEKAAYLRVIEELAGTDAEQYKALYEKGRTGADRLANGGRKYQAARQQIPEFSPCSLQEYRQRFDEVPTHIHQAVYARAWQMAVDRLQQAG